jgi:hypothetical protein
VAHNKLTGMVSFTDGWRHYAITASGFTTWEGSQSEPPTG